LGAVSSGIYTSRYLFLYICIYDTPHRGHNGVPKISR